MDWAEEKAVLKVAENMIAMGMKNDEIKRATELSIEKIQELRKKHQQ